MEHLLIISILGMGLFNAPQNEAAKSVEKNGMAVSWSFEKGRIHFTMEAPTDGWVAIGFNENEEITGAYLLMGRVRDGEVEVVEHYTERPGRYGPLTDYGEESRVSVRTGEEDQGSTSISFSLPTEKGSRYTKALQPGSAYTMIMAFSRSDDFQHHSIMRTSESVGL